MASCAPVANRRYLAYFAVTAPAASFVRLNVIDNEIAHAHFRKDQK
jgi:hypothetical protein